MSVRARIGGVPILGSASAAWTLRSGVQASTHEFDVQPSDVTTLLSGNPQPIQFIVDDASPALSVAKLFAIHEAASEDPNIGRVVVADLRWWWSYQSITRRYNVRRNVGVRRLTNPSAPELQPVVDTVWYAPYSLKGNASSSAARWTAREVLEDVLAEACARVPGGASFRIDPEIGEEVPIENLEIDDPADQALYRVLSYLPEAAVTVDKGGTVVVYSKTTGFEGLAVDNLGPPSVGGGHVEFVRMARVRPSAVHVLFQREIEVRFDAEEGSSTGSTSARDSDARFAENVLPVPDFQLAVAGDVVCQGTWIPVASALAAWGSAPIVGTLDFPDLRKLLVPYMDLWSALGLAGTFDPDADWASRIAALQAHWRQTFRINRRWMDRILSLRAWRVATIDPSTGTRGPAVAFSDHCYLSTMRSLFQQAQGNADLSYAINVQGWPEGGRISPTTRPAPARVSILDHDQGIVHLEYLSDPVRMFEPALPGQIELEGDNTEPGQRPSHAGPTADITQRIRPVTFDSIGEGQRPPMLTGSHKAAFIVSAIPGGPNDDRQFTRLVRRPDDVANLLPQFAREGLADARGPIMEVRVGAGVETARVAWIDDFANLIEAAFGVSGSPGQEPELSNLTINRSSDAGGGSLDAIATTVAARIYASFCDHREGAKTVMLSPGAVPTGYLDEVAHQVGEDGTYQTTVTMPPRPPTLNLWAMLPDSTRRYLMRLATPGKV